MSRSPTPPFPSAHAPLIKPSRRALLGGLAALTATASAPLAFAQTEAELAPIDRAVRRLFLLNRAQREEALAIVHAYENMDIVPSLIVALRFAPGPKPPINRELARLTGETDRSSWFDWMLWQEAHPEVTPHPSYLAFKRDLLLDIDPNFDLFLRDEYLAPDRMRIRFEEIAWGGVRKDGIPSLDNPDAHPGRRMPTWLRDDDLVFGAAIGGDVRAYPLRIMGWHEMFNETIGGVPLALAYCTLCGAGILYETASRGARSRPVRLRLLGVSLPLEQADVRPRDPLALEPVHWKARGRTAR